MFKKLSKYTVKKTESVDDKVVAVADSSNVDDKVADSSSISTESQFLCNEYMEQPKLIISITPKPKKDKFTKAREAVKKLKWPTDVFVAIWCVKQIYPNPEEIDWINALMTWIPYNSRICKRHAEMTNLLSANTEFNPSHFCYSSENKEAKHFDSFWDHGKDNNRMLTSLDYKSPLFKDPKKYPKLYANDPTTYKEDDWNTSILRGADRLSSVYNNMIRKDGQPSSKVEVGDMYIYGFLAVAAYQVAPFEYLKNVYHYKEKLHNEDEKKKGKKFEPGLVTQLAMQKRCFYYLKEFKAFDESNESLKGVFGGRKVTLKSGLSEIKKYWQKYVLETSEGKTPVDNEIQKRSQAGDSKGCDTSMKVDIPRYMIGYNDTRREIFIIVKGTSTMGDALTDAVCYSFLSACGKGECHGQMQIAAILMACTIYGRLKREMASGKYDRIACIGHSLGAGTASLLGILLNTSKEEGGGGFENQVKVFGYGTPPVIGDVDENCAFVSKTNEYILAVVNQHDLVSRIAQQHMNAYLWGSNNADLMSEITGKHNKEKKDKKKSVPGTISNGVNAGIKTGQRALVKVASDIMESILRAASGNKKYRFTNLWIPGRVQHISYLYKGQVEFAKDKINPLKWTKRKQLDSEFYVDETKLLGNNGCKIEVETKQKLMLHEIPRNHPRTCRFILDGRMGLDHLMVNYLRHLAEIYEEIPGKDHLEPQESQNSTNKSVYVVQTT